jgi:hypothetical protein
MRGFVVSLIFGLMGSALATDLPKDLSYQGKPIDPLCFSLVGENKSNQIDLSKCGLSFEKYSPIVPNDAMKKQGFIGFDWEDKQQTYTTYGYSYYKYFNAEPGAYWVYSVNNTGGSGSFSMLMLVKRLNDHTLSYKPYFGGDRCNGGIANVKGDENGQMKISVNLTPYDVINPDGENASKLAAYDDLAACAACCIAKANYVISKDKSQFQGISLNNFQPKDALPEQGKYQHCFNQLVKDYLKRGQKNLNEQQVKGFISDFNKKCLQ